MTNHWIDIRNSDCIIIVGSNAAENHPISFKWIAEAREKRGATLISLDPRFTRSSATADIYGRFRSGTDIALFGGIIKWVLDDMEANPGKYNMTYVTEYTNASFLINPDFKTATDNDVTGLFSGFNQKSEAAGSAFGSYDKSTWAFQKDEDGIVKKDKTLKDPNCVYQLLKKHFSRYDVDTVVGITGIDKDTFLKVCETYAATGAPDKSGTIMYAMGTTQHTHGTQNIRSYAILQLLLGNVGVAGGGINALRGESNVQGSTDHCLLWHILPGYLKPPRAHQQTLEEHLTKYTPKSADPKSANWWQNYPKYYVSLLKSWYGDNATADNEFGYEWLPKVNPGTNYSHIALFEAMEKGDIKGLILWGQNPAVGGPDANQEREAMRNLEWMVAVDLWETESSAVWKEPNKGGGDVEVFLLPAAASFEKEGSVVNSGRWSQWRWKAAEPPGEAREDLEIVNDLMLRVIDLYEAEGGAVPEPITKLRWKGWYDKPQGKFGAANLVDLVSREINGFAETDILNEDGTVKYRKGDLLLSFGHLKADGTTSSSNWLYTQSYNLRDGNRQKWRDPKDYHPASIGITAKWSWCWPVNRRIIYNRASVDLDGNPFAPDKFVIRWTGKKWEGDVPDGGWKPMNMEGTRYAFIMKPEGHAHIFGPGRTDGPFPEHYEPLETPLSENPLSQTLRDPAIKVWRPNEIGDPSEYPVVCTTYRLTEHWQAGQMTRNLPWLVEMMPQVFVELSRELAEELGVSNAGQIRVISTRGSVLATAIVTNRFKPLTIMGKKVHQIGLPWHFGFIGLATGDSANVLTPHVGDANTMIPEFKAFLVKVEKA